MKRICYKEFDCFTVSLNVLKVYPANINLLVPLIQKGCYITDCNYFIKPRVLVNNFCRSVTSTCALSEGMRFNSCDKSPVAYERASRESSDGAPGKPVRRLSHRQNQALHHSLLVCKFHPVNTLYHLHEGRCFFRHLLLRFALEKNLWLVVTKTKT